MVNKSNLSGWFVRWLLIMEEFDIDIVHLSWRQHDNVDDLTRAYEEMGDVSKDNDFPNATIMTTNVEKLLEKYRKIIQYLNGMRFPLGTTKAMKTRITHKNWHYLIIGNQLYFQGRDGVLRWTIEKGESSRLLYAFHDGFCGGPFARQIIIEFFLQASYYLPTFFKDAYDYCRNCDVC